jgi:hypothetical protein
VKVAGSIPAVGSNKRETVVTQVALKERSTGINRRVESLRTLVLNADGRPIQTWPLNFISASDAVKDVWLDKAIVVDTWEDAFFRSPSTQIAVPKVLMLRSYANTRGEPKYCRMSVYLRDRFCCQYCGKKFTADELTLDHVVPRADKGESRWDNVVACCVPCNAAKGNQRANHSGRKAVPGSLRPLKQPRRPTAAELMRAGLELLPNDVKEDFGSWLYWNAELKA